MTSFNDHINKYFEKIGRENNRSPEGRSASFDYCYNYFYSFYQEGNIRDIASTVNMQSSCLQLGFYLASWGMLRGSSFLLQKSMKHYEDTIITIANSDPMLWDIDLDNYDDKYCRSRILQCKENLIRSIENGISRPTDTLITKIMLGVFGNIPAFDTYFTKGIKSTGRRFSGTLNTNSLLSLFDLYQEHMANIDATRISTLSFATGTETNIQYTKAKIIDMYGVMKGNDKNQ